MEMTSILETERLSLREFNTADAAFIIQLLNSEGWLKFIGDRHIKTIEQAENYLTNGPMKSYSVNGFGLSMVELKNTHTPIGMCGLIKRDNLPDIDIGFAFLEEFMGNGYAFEIAQATINFAKESLKKETILAITIPTNVRSINLLKKIGMKFEKNFSFEGSTEELMLFRNK
jgi:RimJ/RimL family protein N-acetyltransferase